METIVSQLYRIDDMLEHFLLATMHWESWDHFQSKDPYPHIISDSFLPTYVKLPRLEIKLDAHKLYALQYMLGEFDFLVEMYRCPTKFDEDMWFHLASVYWRAIEATPDKLRA